MELVLVLVVISTVLALSSPSLRGFFASRQSADAAMNVLSLIQWARSDAIAQGTPVRLNIDSNSYWLTVQQAGAYVETGDEMSRHFQLPPGATLSIRSNSQPPASYLQFYPSGRADAVTIEITGRQGEIYIITSASATEPYRVITPAEADTQ